MIVSRGLVCVVLMTYCALTCAVSLHGRQRRASSEYLIDYVSGKPPVPVQTQSIVITDIEEVKLDDVAVIDYKNGFVTFLLTPEAVNCNVIKLDREIIPALESINNALKTSTNNQLKMPTGSHTINLKVSADKSPLELSPLSRALCGERTIVRMEKDSRTASESTAVARRKRDVGPWEVGLILVVVVVFFVVLPGAGAAAAAAAG